jgi:hypothetical protein
MELKTDSITLRVDGACGIMFDRFYGQEKDTRPPEQKFYFAPGNKIVLPTENLYSFLFGENPAGAAKSEGKKGKEYIRMGYSHVLIDPVESTPFQRNGKDIVFDGWEGNEASYYISEFSPRTKMASGPNSIKQNLKKRPVLLPPWSVTFTVTIIKNPLITAEKIFNWFSDGGILIGLGTYRPRFGRFSITEIR